MSQVAARESSATIASWLVHHVVSRSLPVAVDDLLWLDLPSLNRQLVAPVDGPFQYHWLTSEQLLQLSSDPQWDLPESFAEQLDKGNCRCLAAWDGPHLAGYTWYALRDLPRGQISSYAIAVPSGTAYMFKAFTLPSYRGRLIYPTGVATAFAQLVTEGIRGLFALVEWRNLASLAACRRVGFRRIGRVWRCTLAQPDRVWQVSAQGRRSGLRFGTAAGDVMSLPAAAAGTLAAVADSLPV